MPRKPLINADIFSHNIPGRLIVVRAGDNSLHPIWLKSEPNRKWNLHISYYGKRIDPYDLPPGVTISRDAGQKWIGILSCLQKNPSLLEYNHVIFPDDDLKIVGGSWDEIFGLAESTRASICQPALDHRSFYFHDVTLNRSWLDYREVNFIELMSPMFEKNFLKTIMPFFDENKSSLGLDYLWSKLAHDSNRLMVISDKTVMLHTRDIGGGTQYIGLDPQSELKIILEKYNLESESGRSLRGFRGGRMVPIPASLLNRKEFAPRIFKLIKKFMKLETIG